jgi:serine/threonine protein kinase
MTTLMLEPGTRFVSFDIERLIGSGGMGQVYRVTYHGEPFALKVVDVTWTDQEVLLERVKAEGQMLEWMHHRYIVNVHERGIEHEKLLWIRMELLDGATLRDEIHLRGRLSVPLACRYLGMVASALQ